MTFFNIFSSSKPKKPEEKTKIIIDNHEKNSLIASELSSLGFPIEFQHLEVADYLINNIAIERKTISDLESSIINRRIFSQLKEIQQYSKYLLLIEGFEKNDVYSSAIRKNAIRGFILWVLLEQKVPIVFTQDEKDSAEYLAVIARKQSKRNSQASLRYSKIADTKEKQVQFILEGFPGIGPVKSKSLLKKFKSLRNIINAKEEEIKEILGEKAEDFKSVIDYSIANLEPLE